MRPTTSLILVGLLVMILLCSQAAAQDHWVIDFESDTGLWTIPPDADRGDAVVRLVGEDEGAIDGTSLQADSMGLDNWWHEFLHTTDKLKLKPGAKYLVSMDAYIADINLGQRKDRPAFYFMLRSRALGASQEGDVYGPFWLREKGARTNVAAVFTTPEGIEDEYLNIGIRKQGKLVVDNIQITQITGASPASGKSIKPLGPDTHPAWQVLEDHRAKHDLGRTLDEFTVVGIFEMCNGTMNEVTEFMGEYVRPDGIDWASRRHPAQHQVAKKSGSWYTTSAHEYQEHYKVEEPELWDRRWELLLPSGMTKTLSGQINYWETFGEGGYYMCHNGPFWNDYYRSRTAELVEMAQGICQDNIGVPPFTSAKGCFCTHCEARFREHLKRLYTGAELEQMGIGDIESFSFRHYALENGLVGEEALEDALVREYLRFQHLTHRNRWLEHAAAFKERADLTDHAFSTSGNQIRPMSPYSVMLSPTNDIVEVERLEHLRDYRPPNASPSFKVARASGHNQRPVWFRGTHRVGPDDDLNVSWASVELHYGEAAANGCIRAIHMADDHWPKLEVTKAYTRIPEIREMTKGWADLVRENRAIYSHRESAARVALVYVMPSFMWHDFYALDILDEDNLRMFRAASNSLDAAHVPHDVLIFGYEGLYDDAWSLQQMQRYDALIVPTAESISDKHIQALADYAASGGSIYMPGDFGLYNENYEPRTSQPGLPSGAAVFHSNDRAVKRIARRFGLKTNAPEEVVMNPWVSADGHALALHVVNYDLSAKTSEINKSGEIEVCMPLPAGRTKPYDTAYMLAVGRAALPVGAEYDFDSGTVLLRFTLDRPYGAVVLADWDELRAKEIEIRSRVSKLKSELRAYSAEHLKWPPQ